VIDLKKEGTQGMTERTVGETFMISLRLLGLDDFMKE
jgi:hypothetical protein